MNGFCRTFLSAGRALQSFRQLHSSNVWHSAYEGPGRTTLDVLDAQSTPLMMITNCSPAGFEISNKMFVVGSIMLFPKTVLSWKVKVPDHINEESLSLLTALAPKPDLVIIGTHLTCDQNTMKRIRQIGRKHQLPLEILEVKRACEVYNFIINESRFAVGCLIPPWHEKRVLPDKNETTELTFVKDSAHQLPFVRESEKKD